MTATRAPDWSPRAIGEVADVGAFLAERNPAASEKWLARIEAAAQRVARHPRLGRIVPERGREDLRESIEGNYRVVYRVLHHGIEIVTVFHGAREFPDDVK